MMQWLKDLLASAGSLRTRWKWRGCRGLGADRRTPP